ncbi:MAG: TlpA disulfide reductase family protein, partial [Bacteroidota bacterium]
IMLLSNDEKFKTKISKKYETIGKLAIGMPSPQFINYENHKGGTMSLNDLRGQYIYIDVWATWCAPCLREIPSLKKIEEKYADKNIAFLSLSIDSARNYEGWKKMVNDKELGGIQLLADKDWKSSFIVDYAIESIPRFLLIDPEGNIVSANAPRPSNKDLIVLLDGMNI